jgi:hypothetical protein
MSQVGTQKYTLGGELFKSRDLASITITPGNCEWQRDGILSIFDRWQWSE